MRHKKGGRKRGDWRRGHVLHHAANLVGAGIAAWRKRRHSSTGSSTHSSVRHGPQGHNSVHAFSDASTVRHAPVRDGGDPAYVTKLNRKWGKKPRKTVKQAFKLINSEMDNYIYRYQGIFPFNSANGYFSLSRDQTGGVPANASTELLPLMLFDLCANNFNTSTSSNNTCGWVLRRTFTALKGNYDFVAATAKSADGVTGSTQWQIEDATTSKTSVRKALLDWLDLRLVCVGPTQMPCKFVIQIVQFKNDWEHPQACIAGNVLPENEAIEKNAFWDAQVWPLITNPIDILNPSKKKFDMKVVHSVSFILDPKESSETQPMGHCKIVKIFKRFNRLQRYDWDQQAQIDQTTALPNIGWQVNNSISSLQDNVVPRARMYLMVKAENFTGGAGGLPTLPSFDIMMRKKMIVPQL